MIDNQVLKPAKCGPVLLTRKLVYRKAIFKILQFYCRPLIGSSKKAKDVGEESDLPKLSLCYKLNRLLVLFLLMFLLVSFITEFGRAGLKTLSSKLTCKRKYVV